MVLEVDETGLLEARENSLCRGRCFLGVAVKERGKVNQLMNSISSEELQRKQLIS